MAAFGRSTAAQQDRATEWEEPGVVERWKPFTAGPCVECQGKKTMECTSCNGGRKESKVKCQECNGKKVAPCRTCHGTGSTWDVFQVMSCSRCDARAFAFCSFCGGTLRVKKGEGTEACRVCEKKGGTQCPLCKGKQRLRFELPGGKPFESASLEELEQFQKRFTPALDAAKAYSNPEARHGSLDYDKAMEKVAAVAPWFKDMIKYDAAFAMTVIDKYKDKNAERWASDFRAWSAQVAAVFLQNNMSIALSCESMLKRNNERRKARSQANPGAEGEKKNGEKPR